MDRLFDQNISIVDDWMDEATERAKIAFAAGAVEWIGWRLDGVAPDTDLLELAQALWAAMVDIRYWKNLDRGEPESGGALEWLTFTVWQEAEALMRLSAKAQSNSEDLVHLALLARHVLPKSAHGEFKKWLTVLLDDRVGVHWQLDDASGGREERLGPLVSREALDPAQPLDEAAIPAQVDVLLRSIDWKNNRYLRSPDELAAIGFSGTPYTL
ncbi:hypothetical protein [Rhizobacter sp. P5_C2]